MLSMASACRSSPAPSSAYWAKMAPEKPLSSKSSSASSPPPQVPPTSWANPSAGLSTASRSATYQKITGSPNTTPAQALLHRPKVLFLDEPTDGVDPVGRKEIRELLLEEKRQGVTVFVNSHLLGEVEQLCDRVAILRKGTLVLQGTVAELTQSKPTWLVAFDGPVPENLPWNLDKLEQSECQGLLRLFLDSAAPEAIDQFLSKASSHGLRLRHLQRERGSLEDLYLSLADRGGPAV